jgi:DNA-binding MarR family transcriptional regulator
LLARLATSEASEATYLEDDTLARLDAALEEVRRRLRVRLRRELHAVGSEFVGGGFQILAQLTRAGAQSPSELADALELRTSTMTAHLDRLEESGFVRRQPRPAGGGAARVEVRLTNAGETAYERYLETRRRVLREVLAGVDAADLRRLADVLGQAAGTDGAIPLAEEG